MVDGLDLFPGQWQPQVVLMAALEVGLIEALLDRPRRPPQVAQELGLDERATLRVLGALVDAGYLERQGDGVVVAPDARALLDPHDDAFVGDRLLHLHHLLARWVQLPEVLRHGGPARFERTPESLRAFIGAMRGGARQRAGPLADRLAELFPHTKTVLDIGGGPGTQALAFQEHGWQVTVLDFPDVIELMAATSNGPASAPSRATRRRASPPGLRPGLRRQPLPLDVAGRNALRSWRAPPALLAPAAPWPSTTSCAARAWLRRSSPSTCSWRRAAATSTSEDDYRGWCEDAGLRGFAVHDVDGQSQRLLTAAKP